MPTALQINGVAIFKILQTESAYPFRKKVNYVGDLPHRGLKSDVGQIYDAHSRTRYWQMHPAHVVSHAPIVRSARCLSIAPWMQFADPTVHACKTTIVSEEETIIHVRYASVGEAVIEKRVV